MLSASVTRSVKQRLGPCGTFVSPWILLSPVMQVCPDSMKERQKGQISQTGKPGHHTK
jgi:hypothetical protein